MTDMDWSKAPEGTTHYGPPTENYFGNWFQAHLCGWSIFYENRWVNVGEIQKERFDSLVFRPTQWGPYTTVEAAPQPWSGEDGSLPPVGLKCETLWSSTTGEYGTALILAHDENRAVYRLTSGERKGEYGSDVQHTNFGEHLPIFRPIRTAEQIAAEERMSCAKEFHTLVCPEGKWHKLNEDARESWASIYDAGYRKVQP